MELPIFHRDDMTPREQLNDLIERIAVLQKYQTDMALLNSLDAEKIAELKTGIMVRQIKIDQAASNEERLLRVFPEVVERWEAEQK